MLTDEVLTNMIVTAERFSGSKVNVPIAPCSFPVLAEALIELKERRASELRPATKFVNLPLGKHIEKIHEEFGEVLMAALADDVENLREELVDLQMTCETALAKTGLDEAGRRNERKKKRAKNKARGYYNE